MQDFPLAGAVAQLSALVAHYPWQTFAVVLVVVLLVTTLLSDDKLRGSGGDLDLGLFGGDGDGGDGGGGD
jgi:hypothetical protein